MKFEVDYIEKLANVLSKNDLTELMIEDGEKAIVLRKEKEVLTAQVAPLTSSPLETPVTPADTKEEPKSEAPAKKGTPVNSPMVGTFYKAASPGADPFIEVGKTISAGQTVCIIEAMKLMNEIEAEVSGKVTEICVEDGQPVEFGQVLMYVE